MAEHEDDQAVLEEEPSSADATPPTGASADGAADGSSDAEGGDAASGSQAPSVGDAATEGQGASDAAAGDAEPTASPSPGSLDGVGGPIDATADPVIDPALPTAQPSGLADRDPVEDDEDAAMMSPRDPLEAASDGADGADQSAASGAPPADFGALNTQSSDTQRLLPIRIDEPTDFWSPQKGERKVRFLVVLGACLVFLPNLGGFGLWDPWETHYGAVTTNMVETYDWISPWWGYKEKIGTEKRQGNYFFSKPVLIFWTEALASNFFGRSEWSIRLPMALLAILAVFLAYLALSRIWTRRVGLLGALIMATSPQFFMISRQAQTDMPFVGTMTIAMCFLMLALFAKARRHTDKSFWAWTGAALAGLLLVTIPQYGLLVTDLATEPPASAPNPGLSWQLLHQGTYHALIYGSVLASILGWFGWSLRRDIQRRGLTQGVKDKWLRRWLMVWFYIFCGLSFYAKGLLFLIPGAVICVWLLVTVQWRVLARVELIRGIVIFLCVSLPWYVAMFVKHGNAFYQRFFVHDHFNRLGAGVHQIDSGTFEHFIKWLGIGMFPWAIFVPFALIWMFRLNTRDRRASNQAAVFVAVWFAFAFMLFTLSSTKFHHYIFPAMPALTMLTALFINQLLDDKTWLPRLVTVVGVVFFAALSWDLHEDPQHVRNLMTYKYDRPLPDHLPIDPQAKVSKSADTYTWEESTFWRHTTPLMRAILTTDAFRYDNWIPLIAVWGFIALGLFFVARHRRKGLAALGLLAAMFALWSLNYYMPSLSPHWSQKYLFDSYYDTCQLSENPEEIQTAYTPLLPAGLAASFGYNNKRVCHEDVISWLITWRGETYYSYNELQPITKEQPQFMPYLEARNHGEKFYALMERGKMAGFKSKLQRYSDKLKRKGQRGWRDVKSWDVKVENDESRFFQMVSATPVR